VSETKRVKRKRRKPELSKEELMKVAYGLSKFGDMLVMMGEIVEMDKELRKSEKLMKKLFRTDIEGLFSAIEADSALSAKIASFVTKLAMLSSIMEKDFFEMSPDEQIEAGKGLKEFSSLLKEIAESMEED
jgi:5'-deoxynucleotidase YfbR-like HD superfamily hydrolase